MEDGRTGRVGDGRGAWVMEMSEDWSMVMDARRGVYGDTKAEYEGNRGGKNVMMGLVWLI